MRGPSRLPEILLALFVVVALFFLIGPGYTEWASRSEPRVLGLPFSLTWHIGWIIASCIALALFDRAVRSRDSS